VDENGRVALVTGAARGLGWGIARALGQAGAAVCLTDINEEELARAERDLRADGATLWLRPATAEPLTVMVDAKPHRVKKIQPGVEQRINFHGLKPNTVYRYAVLAKKAGGRILRTGWCWR